MNVMLPRKNFTFSGVVESVQYNLITAAVFLPHHIVLDLPRGRVKANGIINGVPFSLSILYRKDAGRYFPISGSLRRAANLTAGDRVDVKFNVIDSERVELPTELETVLDEDDKARKIWKKLNITLQKMLADYVDSAKRIDMRVRRALETVQRAKSGMLQPQATRKRKSS